MSSQHSTLASDKYKSILPPTFLHGLASASYQIEGSPSADGKGVGVWDDFLSKKGMETGDVACESYKMWEEDVKLLKELGCNVYRFSISWPRIRPDGESTDWCTRYNYI
jgi:beta-glucosidase